MIKNNQMLIFIAATIILATATACSTPLQSQQFFAKAVEKDPMLEPLHTTPLYTVYYDHGLRRCVLHAAYTWGESGGGTGGTGIGVTIFNCDPAKLKAHSNKLRRKANLGVTKFKFPVSRSPKKASVKQPEKTSHPAIPSLNAKPAASKNAAPLTQDSPEPQINELMIDDTKLPPQPVSNK